MNPIEKCQKCGQEEDDLRTLWMKCFYDMTELGLPFEEEKIREGGIDDTHPDIIHQFYTLRVCKTCRASWMEMIETWFQFDFSRSSPKTGIFIRHFGAIIEITEEEWRERSNGQEPVRFKHDK